MSLQHCDKNSLTHQTDPLPDFAWTCFRSFASLRLANDNHTKAVQLPGQVRSQVQLGNEENRQIVKSSFNPDKSAGARTVCPSRSDERFRLVLQSGRAFDNWDQFRPA